MRWALLAGACWVGHLAAEELIQSPASTPELVPVPVTGPEQAPGPVDSMTRQLLERLADEPVAAHWQICVAANQGWNNFDICLQSASGPFREQLQQLVADDGLHAYLSRRSAEQGGVTLQFGERHQHSLILLNTAYLDSPVHTFLAPDTYVLGAASRATRVFYHELGHVQPIRCAMMPEGEPWQRYRQELMADIYLFYRLVTEDGDYRRVSDWVHRRNLGLLATTPDLDHWSSYTLLALMAKYTPADIRQWRSFGEFRQAMCGQPALFLTSLQLLEINTLVQRRLVAGTASLTMLNFESQKLLSATLYGTLVSLMGEPQAGAYLRKLALALPVGMTEVYQHHPIARYPLAGISKAMG